MVSGNDRFKPWEVLHSREIFSAPGRIRLCVQRVGLPDGRVVDDYYQVEMPNFAVIFALTADGPVILERQYKHGAGECTLTLPSGGLKEGEDPLEGAKRELLEETGYESDDWSPIGDFVVNMNQGCGKAYLFLARNARKVAEPDSGDLEEMEIVLIEPEAVLAAVKNGEVVSLSSAAAIALATNKSFGGDG